MFGLRINRFTIFILFVLTASALALSSEAQALPLWELPPENISTEGEEAGSPKIAFYPNGAAIAVWVVYLNDSTVIRAAVRPPGGSFGPAENVSDASLTYVGLPEVDISPDNKATIVWQADANDSGLYVVQTATQQENGAFGPPETISAPTPAGGVMRPQIAIGNNGITVVTWEQGPGSTGTIQASIRQVGGSFSSPQEVANEPSRKEVSSQVAFAPNGKATVSWISMGASPANKIKESTQTTVGGAFGAASLVYTSGTSLVDNSLSIGKGGKAIILWQEYLPLPGNRQIKSVSRDPGDVNFSNIVKDISPAGEPSYNKDIAIDQGNVATIVWHNDTKVRERILLPDGSLTIARDISTEGASPDSPPKIVALSDNRFVATWAEEEAGITTIKVAEQMPDSWFGVPERVSSLDGNTPLYPQIAASPDVHNVLNVAWVNLISFGNEVVQAISSRVPTFNLSVNSSGDGRGIITSDTGSIDCGTLCSTDVDVYNPSVKLTAYPSPGSKFLRWSSNCVVNDNVCFISVDQNRSVVAEFSKLPSVDPSPNPPLNPSLNIAVFDGKKLSVLVKCAKKYKPRCNLTAVPTTKKNGKPMSKKVRKKVKSGKSVKIVFVIKKKYRTKITKMIGKKKRLLTVRTEVKSRKINKKNSRGKSVVSYIRYRVK